MIRLYPGDKLLPRNIIPAKATDFSIRANLETRKVEMTFLPTGKMTALSVEETSEFIAQLLDALRELYAEDHPFIRLEESFLRLRADIRAQRNMQ